MNNVLIIDEHSLTRFGLRTALKSRENFNEILEAGNAEKAIELSKKFKPSLVIMDLSLPSSRGIEVITQLRALNKNTKIVIFTNHTNEEDILDVFCAGIRAYCLKTIELEKFLNVVETILDGAIWFDPVVSGKVLKILTKERKQDKSDRQKPQLTAREIDVLKLIVNGHNNSEISKKLCISIHTAKAHVCSILHKLCVEDRTQAAILALKNRII